jgi:nucleotide-binding universal stress UspA family protein
VRAPYAHIGCLIDGPSCGVMALGTAIALWRAAGGRLSVVHVGPPPAPGPLGVAAVLRRGDPGAPGRDLLRATVRGIAGAEAVCLNGPAAEAVRAWAEGAGADLLVVGAGAGAPLLHDLAGDAPGPVLVARPPLTQGGAGAPVAGVGVPAIA